MVVRSEEERVGLECWALRGVQGPPAGWGGPNLACWGGQGVGQGGAGEEAGRRRRLLMPGCELL